MSLPPYTGELTTCTACGHDTASTEYRATGTCVHDSDEQAHGFTPNPRLHRNCARCGFQWDEATVAAQLVEDDALARAEAERDGAYRERARLVAHLASLYPSQIAHTDPNTPDWPVVTIETPTGQMSWHVAARDVELFEHVDRQNGLVLPWDGHTTEQKYERLRQLTVRPKRGL